MKVTRESSECLAAVFADKLRDLQDKRFTELQSLPETDEEVIQCRDGVFSLTTYRYLIAADQLSIVLQAYRPLILGAGTMRVEGFRRSVNETTTPLTQDELAEHS